jgi:hypothetical protein
MHSRSTEGYLATELVICTLVVLTNFATTLDVHNALKMCVSATGDVTKP